MHVGELPYVVTTSSSNSTFRGPLSWGQVELSSRPLTADAVLGMLGQMLTHEQSRTLYEVGAVEHEIAAPGDSGERFIVTAARGGDDVWVEVRRKPKAVEAAAEAPETPASAESPAPVEEPSRVEVELPVEIAAAAAPVTGTPVEPLEDEPQPSLVDDAIAELVLDEVLQPDLDV